METLDAWMCSNNLLLNPSKFICSDTFQELAKIELEVIALRFPWSVQDLGVTLDQEPTFTCSVVIVIIAKLSRYSEPCH